MQCSKIIENLRKHEAHPCKIPANHLLQHSFKAAGVNGIDLPTHKLSWYCSQHAREQLNFNGKIPDWSVVEIQEDHRPKLSKSELATAEPGSASKFGLRKRSYFTQKKMLDLAVVRIRELLRETRLSIVETDWETVLEELDKFKSQESGDFISKWIAQTTPRQLNLLKRAWYASQEEKMKALKTKTASTKTAAPKAAVSTKATATKPQPQKDVDVKAFTGQLKSMDATISKIRVSMNEGENQLPSEANMPAYLILKDLSRRLLVLVKNFEKGNFRQVKKVSGRFPLDGFPAQLKGPAAKQLTELVNAIRAI